MGQVLFQLCQPILALGFQHWREESCACSSLLISYYLGQQSSLYDCHVAFVMKHCKPAVKQSPLVVSDSVLRRKGITIEVAFLSNTFMSQ